MSTSTRTPPTERKIVQYVAVPFEIKADTVDGDARTFQGLASTWSLDLGNDVIHQGAYARTLSHWKDSGRTIPLIDLHGYDSVKRVVGKLIAAEETAEGLLCTFQVIKPDPGDTDADADAAWRRVKGGFITGLSIGYRAVRYDYEQPEGTDSYWDRIRHLHEIELREVSLVIWGMQPGALIDTESAKGLADALRSGHLTDEQKQQLRALLEDAPADAAPADDPATPPADAPKGLAPDAQAALKQRLLRIQLQRLATRADAARHA